VVETALVKAVRTGLLACAALAACVPTGNAPPYDAGPTPSSAPTYKPSANVMTAPFEDTFDRPDAGEGTWAPFGADASSGGLVLDGGATAADAGRGDAGRGLLATASDAAGDAAFGDAMALSFDAAPEAAAPSAGGLGPNWTQVRTSAWRIEGGKLCVQNAKNHGVWLNRTLPVNARIEFDATAHSDDGDIKAELWGDGYSAATGTSYTNASSYLAILGGWKNTTHVLARLNEHGGDRKAIMVDKDSDDPRQRAVMKGQTYHFKVERTDGKTVKWSVDGVDYFSWTDALPLAGHGHDHFGFNEWEAKVCFDNVKITPL